MSGTPVVGINKMGVKDVIGTSGGGILCNESLDEYVYESIQLLTSNEKLNECKQQALKRGNDYASEVINQKLEALYSETITQFKLNNSKERLT